MIDGSKISLELLKINNPNSVLIGAFVKLFKNKIFFSRRIYKKNLKKGKKRLLNLISYALKKGLIILSDDYDRNKNDWRGYSWGNSP